MTSSLPQVWEKMAYLPDCFSRSGRKSRVSVLRRRISKETLANRIYSVSSALKVHGARSNRAYNGQR